MNWSAIRSAGLDDWPRIAALLTASALPLAGAEEHVSDFLVAELAGQIVGCAAVERYGSIALLRSVAVASEARGNGLGAQLVHAALSHADAAGCLKVVLLTTTAAAYFPRFGFHGIARDATPEPVRASVEFTSACPASAVVMLRDRPKVGGTTV